LNRIDERRAKKASKDATDLDGEKDNGDKKEKVKDKKIKNLKKRMDYQ